MCLLVLAWNVHPRYRLVVAANRDEFHDRPAAPLGWWQDVPGVLAGRDLRGAGTWMGVARSGRFGILTNYRDLEPPPSPDAPSRGELVPQFLAAHATPRAWLEGVRPLARRYAGFNLLVGTPKELVYFPNRSDLEPQPLAPGLYGLSNHLLDSPWPKLLRARERLRDLMERDLVEAETLFALLADRQPAEAESMPSTGLPPDWERALSAPFVVHGRYGTRCSTVLLVERAGRTTVHERRFDASGTQTGASRWHFDVTARERPAPSEASARAARAALREPLDSPIE
jgi:uncharacterized protein with NRDE domain